ncbi:MAG TPA: YaiI/YqxD family protein [Gammaproteobacteria bacterium]
MRIWVDADACPNVIKEIIYRAAELVRIETTLVANQAITTPRSKVIKSKRVAAGFDVADNWIESNVEAGDLVVTADIPLAAAVVEKRAFALNPRGQLYTEENVRERLNMRDMMEELRGAGLVTGGPPTISKSDRQAFANQLDRLLTKRSSD